MRIGLAGFVINNSFLVEKQCPRGNTRGVKPGSDRLQINFSLNPVYEKQKGD